MKRIIFFALSIVSFYQCAAGQVEHKDYYTSIKIPVTDDQKEGLKEYLHMELHNLSTQKGYFLYSLTNRTSDTFWDSYAGTAKLVFVELHSDKDVTPSPFCFL